MIVGGIFGGQMRCGFWIGPVMFFALFCWSITLSKTGDNLRVWRLWRFKSIFSCDEWTTSPTRTGSPHEPMVRFLSIFSVWCFHCTFLLYFNMACSWHNQRWFFGWSLFRFLSLFCRSWFPISTYTLTHKSDDFRFFFLVMSLDLSKFIV